jgi:predicted ATPase/signal transduction histidine kinase/CheY-like chemotaxis protein
MSSMDLLRFNATPNTTQPQASAAIDASAATVVSQSARSIVSRIDASGTRLILKETATGINDVGAMASLRHEHALLHGLDLPGVAEVVGLAGSHNRLALVMRDAGQLNLADRLMAGPMAIGDALDIAAQLADAIAALHLHKIVHRNVNPANIVLDAAHRVTLVDFAIATTLSNLAVDRTSPALLEGALRYLSPEQTGRTGRSVDLRADLYSFGATLNEMLTGSPPFTADDPVELVHAHLARRPRPPHAVRPEVPLALSRIVLKLLEKEPELRYQTADALAADLRHARERWQASGIVEPFALAQHDVPREFKIAEKLYGRADELRTLNDAFARVGAGHRELVLITGEPGIGKSALVSHLERPVVERHARFIAGKFDQLQRSVPYAGIVQAFRMLVRQILSESEAALSGWKRQIQDAVAPNGQVLIDLVPEVQHVIGPQPPVPASGPGESVNRLNLVFTSFLGVFAKAEHPLVLFLDDLQWVDAASLQLITRWMSDGDNRYLFMLGAYRDEEVGLSHPLTLTLAAIRAGNAPLLELKLGPMKRGDVVSLVASALNHPPERVRPVADLVFSKTAGNPFFVRRLLHALHAEGLIRFDQDAGEWRWDLAELERAPLSGNVIEFMVRTLNRLPAPTQHLLQAGACLGHRFDLNLLADVAARPRMAVTADLWPALEEGLLLPLHHAYKAPRFAGPLDDKLIKLPAVLQFAHDRVQQAAYSLMSPQRRRSLHLDIGRRLRERVSGGQPDESLFDVADQLNLGQALIESPAERLSLAQLNLAAGRKAKTSAAYQAAFDYLDAALRQLPEHAWRQHLELSFAIHRELAECAYLTGRHAVADDLVRNAFEHAPSTSSQADLYTLRVLAAMVAGDSGRALQIGREGLALFESEWPLENLDAAIEREAANVIASLGNRRIGELKDAPGVQDEGICACMRLLSTLGPPAYFSGANDILAFVTMKGTDMALRHGPSTFSSYAYVFYGALHHARTGDYDTGYAFGALAVDLARRFGDSGELARTLQVFSLVVSVWKAPLRDTLPLMHEGYAAALKSGELAYAAFTLAGLLINSLPAAVTLSDLLEQSEIGLDFVIKQKNQIATSIILPFRQLVRNLTGKTDSITTFDDDEFTELNFLAQAKGNDTAIGHYWVARLQAAWLAGDLELARFCSGEAQSALKGIQGMFTSAEQVYYTILTLTGMHDALTPAAQGEARETIVAMQQQLGTWAKHCPRSFGHKLDLVDAELARLDGDVWRALRSYRAAIEGAEREGFLQDEAIAHELRGRFLLAQGEPGFAALHILKAHDGYSRWGATVKARRLTLDYPGFFTSRPQAPQFRIGALDTLGLIKSSQAISAETVQARLYERILQIVVEVAGAERGILVLDSPAALVVRARVTADEAPVTMPEGTPLSECPDIPQAILRYVARSKESLVLADAAADGLFVNNPEVGKLGTRSVLCVPLQRQDRFIGLLFLENGAIANAFTQQRVEVVQALASQAVISLENSTLILQREQNEIALRQADRRKDEFLAMLAHELRGPLGAIMNTVHLLDRRTEEPGIRRFIDILHRQTTMLRRLVDDLLDVSRITSGLIELKQERVDLLHIIERALEGVQAMMDAKQHDLSVTLPRRSVEVTGDAVRLEQIMANLLTNAAKYTDDGGSIELILKTDEGQARLHLRDNGIGMTAEVLDRIFELFGQAERGLARSQGGLGIGLTIARNLVEQHGGCIEATSAGLGLGSEFIVTLPLAPAVEPTPAPELPSALPASARGKCVLVVDDNVDIAESLAMLLEESGHYVVVAHDGPSALTTAESEDPEVILLDIGLPGMDGYEVARRLRANPRMQDKTLAAITGYGQSRDQALAMEAGFDRHFTKPVNIAELEAFVDAAALNPAIPRAYARAPTDRSA